MRWVIAVAVLILSGILCAGSPITGEEAPPSAPVLPEGVEPGLTSHGFAVDSAVGLRLSGAYRSDGYPVFVTTDSVVAVYYTLFRRVVGGLGGGVSETLGPWLTDWDDAVREKASGEAGRIARAYTATLRSLCTRPPTDLDDKVRWAVEDRLARLRGERMLTVPTSWEAGTIDDEARLSLLWKKGLTTPRDRFFTVVHWVSRISLPSSPAGKDALSLLTSTMPRALRERILAPFHWIGLAVARFPGRRTVIEIEVPGDLRFPPSTLPDHAHVIGLDLGRRLGSDLAGELLEEEPIMERVVPLTESAARPGSLIEMFETTLATTLDPPDPRAPELFAGKPWQTLALQSALAGHALFRRAAGPFFEPYRLFGGEKHAGLVHPDPEFFAALAKLAERTAEFARMLGSESGSKGGRAKEITLRALEAHLRGTKPLTPEHLAILKSNSLALPDIECLGTRQETRRLRSRMLETVLPFLRESREQSRRTITMWRPAATHLDMLAAICRRFEAAAEAQLEGKEIENATKLFSRDWITFLEDVEGPRGSGRGLPEDPFCAAVAAVIGGPGGIKLMQGSAGFRLLFIHYPVNGKLVLARGAVLAYREHLTKQWLDDKAWASLVEKGIPQPPHWAR